MAPESKNVLKIRESPIVDSWIISRDEKDVRVYRNLGKSEARYRLKERILEQMILSVDNLDNFQESFMMKLEHDHFCNLLLPSNVQEIKQAVGHRLKNIDSTRTWTWNLLIRSQAPYPFGHRVFMKEKQGIARYWSSYLRVMSPMR